MDIYFDFEATQFSERIISIGATCEYGEFSCLISSFAKKITPFITQLTGITKEMVKGAPTADEAFGDLINWIQEVDCGEPIKYHCYGDSDKRFLRNTAKDIHNDRIADFVINMADTIIDDSLIVTRYFKLNTIGVHKALKKFDPEIPDQDHDALNDAILLYHLMEYIANVASIDDLLAEAIAIQVVREAKPKKKKEKKPKNERPYRIIVTHCTQSQSKVRTFNSYSAAGMWLYMKIKAKYPTTQKANIMKRVTKAIDNRVPYANWNFVKEYI